MVTSPSSLSLQYRWAITNKAQGAIQRRGSERAALLMNWWQIKKLSWLLALSLGMLFCDASQSLPSESTAQH